MPAVPRYEYDDPGKFAPTRQLFKKTVQTEKLNELQNCTGRASGRKIYHRTGRARSLLF